MENEETWQAVLAQLQFHISPANFATWLQNTRILSKNDGQVIISAPNNFSKEWIESKYHKLISKILHNLDPEFKDIKYVVNANNLKVKKETPVSYVKGLTELQPSFQEILAVNKDTGLNPRYRLDNFIVGSFNELAQAAALAIIKNPGQSYNPLFIYGGVGLGKTHLIQAIGNEIMQKEHNKVIRYLSAERLINGIVNAIKNHTMDKFKSSYAVTDVLIVDDIQFFAGKEKSQEEFFHLFNNLYGRNKQIILSSDKPPKAIPAIEDRLRSRFEGGMIGDIGYPDFETRMAILKAKTQEKNLHLSPDVLEFIAVNFQKNIRELEGALNRIIAFQEVNNKTVDVDLAKTLLKNIILNPLKRVNYKKVFQIVSEFYDIKEDDLLDPSRKKEIVEPRQVAMYILREDFKYSYPFIGRKFRGKDHTTIMYACAKINKEIKEKNKLSEEIELIRNRIYN